MQRATLAQLLKSAGLVLLGAYVLARIAFGLYAAGSTPSLALFSWEGVQAVLAGWSALDMPFALRLVLGMAAPLGMALWLAGWLLGLRRSPS
jgi:hypothetical protein